MFHALHVHQTPVALAIALGLYAHPLRAEHLSSEHGAQMQPISAVFTIHKEEVKTASRAYLSDLAECTGAPDICEEAYGVEIPDTFNLSKEKILTRETIQRTALHEWPGSKIIVKGLASIKVLPLNQPHPEETAKTQLMATLDEINQKEEFQVSIEKIQLPGQLLTIGGDFKLIFEDFDPENLSNKTWIRKHLRGKQRLKVRLEQEPDAAISSPLSIFVSFKLKERLPVAAQNLSRGDIIQKSDLMFAWYELDGLSRELNDDPDLLKGRKVRLPVKEGSPFPFQSTEKHRLISRGQIANLVIRRDDMTITGKVQTLASGSYGEAIDATLLATKKKLKVRIIDESTVESVF